MGGVVRAYESGAVSISGSNVSGCSANVRRNTIPKLWERSLELATARTSAYKSFDHQELLAAGSWCVVFGCVLSLVLRRPHVLLLFGIAMLGAFFALNGTDAAHHSPPGLMLTAPSAAIGLMPTVQFALCLALPVTDLSRALTQPQPAVAAAGPAAAARPKRD